MPVMITEEVNDAGHDDGADEAPDLMPKGISTKGTNNNAALERIRVRVLPDGRLTRADAATYLGMKPKTLAMWALEGRGPPVRKVGGRCFYFQDQLDAFVRGDG